jgi:hypothetical protein
VIDGTIVESLHVCMDLSYTIDSNRVGRREHGDGKDAREVEGFVSAILCGFPSPPRLKTGNTAWTDPRSTIAERQWGKIATTPNTAGGSKSDVDWGRKGMCSPRRIKAMRNCELFVVIGGDLQGLSWSWVMPIGQI